MSYVKGLNTWEQSEYMMPCSFSSAILPQKYQKIPIFEAICLKETLVQSVLPFLNTFVPEEQYESRDKQSASLVDFTLVITCLIDFVIVILGLFTYILLVLVFHSWMSMKQTLECCVDSSSGLSESQ